MLLRCEPSSGLSTSVRYLVHIAVHLVSIVRVEGRIDFEETHGVTILFLEPTLEGQRQVLPSPVSPCLDLLPVFRDVPKRPQGFENLSVHDVGDFGNFLIFASLTSTSRVVKQAVSQEHPELFFCFFLGLS